MSNDIILEMRNISKRYPGVLALDNVSLSLRKSEVHALVGENGAGKSTLVKMLSGANVPDAGEIVFEGKSYSKLTPAFSKTLGIEIIYQEFNLVPALSVAENIYMGDKPTFSFVDFRDIQEKSRKIFEMMGISIDPCAKVEDLSVAYMQMVEIAKAISKDVKILIMDEPTAPLTDDEVATLFRIVGELKARGVTIIYISHRLAELYEICDTVSVMRDGRMIDTLPIKEATRNALVSMMVGRELKESFPARDCLIDEVALEIRHVTGNGVHDISFKVHRGEVLGLAGLVGAGRTELSHVLFGLAKMEEGEILVSGEKVEIKSPWKAMEYGFGLVPEDRKQHGVLLDLPICWNITLPIIRTISRGTIINRKKEANTIGGLRDALRIKTPSMNQLVKNLSGGNQQKVVLAKWLAAKAKILIFDEPTRGIDVGAKQEIYHLINELAHQGICIIMISSEMEELLGMSDRLLVLCEGRITGELDRKDFSQTTVLHLASGNA